MQTLLNNFTAETLFILGIGFAGTIAATVILANKLGSKLFHKLNSKQ